MPVEKGTTENEATPDSDAILQLARKRIKAVVPEADLLAFSTVFTLIRAADRVTYELDAAQRRMGWTWPGFRILFWVWLLGPLEPRAIASLVSTSRASISSALNTLERDGFVLRMRSSQDRRLVTVDLTARGRTEIQEAFKAVNTREREWLAPFSADEQRVLGRLLGRLLDHVSPGDSSLDDLRSNH